MFEGIMSVLRDYGFYIFMGIFALFVIGKLSVAITRAKERRKKRQWR